MKNTIEINGLTFAVKTIHDEDADAPWDQCDGHGPVTDWTTRDKKPGERVLNSDRNSKRFYDFAGAVKLALKDGWGVKNSEGMTKKQIATAAAEKDYEFLKGWCNDKWHYVGVIVTLLDADGDPTNLHESLFGVEDSDDKYIDETAQELAEELAANLEGKDVLCVTIRKAGV